MADRGTMKNVTVDIGANIYFDGKVQSRTVVTAEGVAKHWESSFPGVHLRDGKGRDYAHAQRRG